MGIAESLNELHVIEFDCDSRSVWLCVREDTENQTPENPLVPVATTGDDENEEYGIAGVDQEMVAGHWITTVTGVDGTEAWWDADKEQWVPGEPG